MNLSIDDIEISCREYAIDNISQEIKNIYDQAKEK